MKHKTRAKDFHNLLMECEEAINGQQLSNVSLSIGLNLFIAQSSGTVLAKDDLQKLVPAPDSTVDRYLLWMENEGVIEKSEDHIEGGLSLSDDIAAKYNSLFGD